MPDLHRTTEDLARLAGQHAKMNQAHHIACAKNGDPRDMLTSVDLEISTLFKTKIAEMFPDDRFYSEEEMTDLSGPERTWIIDPIDGTSNYVRNLPLYSCCVTVVERGAVIAGSIYAPALDECFSLTEADATLNGETMTVSTTTELKEAYVNFHPGRRAEDRVWAMEMKGFLLDRAKKNLNFGSSALDLAYLASGRFDAVVYGTLTTADIAGAIELVRRAGGEVYNYGTGEAATFMTTPQRIIATANRELFEEFQKVMPR